MTNKAYSIILKKWYLSAKAYSLSQPEKMQKYKGNTASIILQTHWSSSKTTGFGELSIGIPIRTVRGPRNPGAQHSEAHLQITSFTRGTGIE